MFGTRYTVKKGDTLWDLSARHLGDPRKWPQIFEHNNRPQVIAKTGTRISDPNLIFVDQTIYLPTKSSPVSKKPVVPPSAKPHPQGNGKAKARPKICSIPMQYQLDDVPAITVISPTHIATIKLSGALTLQSKKTCDFHMLTQHGFELSVKKEADLVFSKLVAENKVGWNAKTKTVNFENGITLHSTNKYTPSVTVSAGISTNTQLPVTKIQIKTPEVKGKLSNHVYLAKELAVSIEITPTPPSAKPVPIPSAKPVPVTSPNTDWDYLIAGTLIAGAAVIIVATIAEDVVSLGAGVADDPVSFTAASAMLARGIALFKRVQSTTAVIIEGAGATTAIAH